jgi:predicted O-methyltransferase YrrM
MIKHFYQQIPHWFDFEDVYRQAIALAPSSAVMLELGVYEGASLAFLAVEAANSHKKIAIHGVDKFDWPAGVFDRVKRWIAREHLGELVTLHKAFTHEAAKDFPDRSLDFVFVDADHDSGSVYRDLVSYWPKLKPGGWMAGHDWCDEFPGVEKACRAFFSQVGRHVEPCSRRSWRMIR